ncbi:MAG: hypothetical protein GY810_22155 [Aureispira sp.]|nr:hypothetical protein [Aureispira sp.]
MRYFWMFLLLVALGNLSWAQSGETLKLAELRKDKIEVLASPEQLKKVSTTMISSIAAPKDYKITYLDADRKIYYLFGNALRDGKEVTFAIALEEKGGELWFERINKSWFVCKNSGCTSCEFTTAIDGTIRRCACPDEGADLNACRVITGIKTNE